jgi:hypothetical protein
MMQPRAYFEMRVVPSFKSERPDGMAHDLMALLVKFTHAIAARQGVKHAIALPQARAIQGRATTGNLLRVFSLERMDLDSIADELEKQVFVRDYVSIGRTKVLADDYMAPGYVEYLRYRVPNRNTGLKESRLKRMKEADGLPYFRLNSSSGHALSLFVKPVYHETANCSDAYSKDLAITFEPDVYGLSVSQRRFALPVTPDDQWPHGQA